MVLVSSEDPQCSGSGDTILFPCPPDELGSSVLFSLILVSLPCLLWALSFLTGVTDSLHRSLDCEYPAASHGLAVLMSGTCA